MASFTLPTSKNIWNFDPTSIAGCTLWLDGADKNTTFQDVAGTTPATSSTNPVSRWNDKTLKLPACLNSASTATATIVGSTAPVISVDSVTGFNTLLFGMGTITITSTVAATGRLNVTSSVTIASGQPIATQFTLGGLNFAAIYYVINPTGTPTTSFQLASTPGGSAVSLTDSSSSTAAVLSSGALSLPYGALTLTSVSGTTLNVTTAQSLTLAVGLSVLFSGTASYSGINTTTTYFITSVTAGNPTTQISISATAGGTAITVTGSGSANASIGRNIFSANTADCTFFTVAKGTGPTPMNSTPFSYGGYLGYGVRAIVHASSTATTVANGTGNAAGSITSGSMNITCASFVSNVMSGWANGTAFTSSNNTDIQFGWSTNNNNGTPVGAAAVGAFVPVYPMFGNVGEILYYNRQLTNAERQQIEGYLAWKWKIQSLLPTGHPYTITSIRPFSRNFVPTDIEGCQLWIDPSDRSAVTLDAATSTKVTQIIDKSGNGNNVTNASSTITYATTLNGLPVLLFPTGGASNSLTTPNITRDPVNRTYFFVIKYGPTSVSGQTRFIQYTGGLGGGQGEFFAHNGSAGTNTMYIEINNNFPGGGGASLSYTSPSGSVDAFFGNNTFIVSSVRQNLVYTFTTNGSSANAPGIAGGGFGLSSGSGYQINAGSQNAVVGDVIIYNTALNTSQRQVVEGYLFWKWGLRTGAAGVTAFSGLGVPTTHPYYKFPPPSLTPVVPTSQFFNRTFTPYDLSPTIWLDPQDAGTYTVDANNRVVSWRNKGVLAAQFITITTVTSTSILTFTGTSLYAAVGQSITFSANITGTPGLVAGTVYFIQTITSQAAGNITVSSTPGGAAITTLTNATGLNVGTNVNPAFTIPVAGTGTGITGPLLTSSSVGGGLGLPYFEFSNGGTFNITAASIGATPFTALTLTTAFTHNIPVGALIYFGCTSGSYIGVTPTVPTGAFTGSGTAVTLTLSSTTGLVAGSVVFISNVTPTALNGTYTVTSVAGSTITFPNTTASASVTIAGSITQPTSSTILTGPYQILSAIVSGGTTLTITTQQAHNIIAGYPVTLTINTGTFLGGASATSLSGSYTAQTGTTGSTIILTIATSTNGQMSVIDGHVQNNVGTTGYYLTQSGTTGSTIVLTSLSPKFTGSLSSFIGRVEYGILPFTSALLTTATSMTLRTPINHGITGTPAINLNFNEYYLPFQTPLPTSGTSLGRSCLSFTSATVSGVTTGTTLTITIPTNPFFINSGTPNYVGLSSLAMTLPTGTLFQNSTSATGISGTGYVTQSGSNTTTLVLTIASSPSGALIFNGNPGMVLANSSVGNAAIINSTQTITSASGNTIVVPIPTFTQAIIGRITNFVSNTALPSFQTPIAIGGVRSYTNYPVNGYALESTSLSTALSTSTMTIVWVSHYNPNCYNPSRNWQNDDNLNPPVISAAFALNGNAGRDQVSNGRDFKIQTASYAGSAPRLALVHNNAAKGNFYNFTFHDVNTPFRVNSCVMNFSASAPPATNDVPASSAGVSTWGWRYDLQYYNVTYISASASQPVATLAPTHLRIGANTNATTAYATNALSSQWYEGGIGDILIFNSILTQEQRQLVEGFLAQKYRCQSFLGTGSTANPTATYAITGGTISGTGPFTVTLNGTFTNSFTIGTTITVAGVTNPASGYNTTWTVLTMGATALTFSSATNIGAWVAGGTVRGFLQTATFVHPYRLNPIIPSGSTVYSRAASLWLDAADSATFSNSGLSNVQWNDKSGNGRNATNNAAGGSVGSNITYVTNSQAGLGGVQIINSTSTNGLTTPSTFPLYTAQQFSFFVVGRVTGGRNGGFISNGFSFGQWAIDIGGPSSNNVISTVGTNGNIVTTLTPSPAVNVIGTTFLISLSVTPTSFTQGFETLYINGKNKTTGTGTISTNQSINLILTRDSNTSTTTYYELIGFSNALSDIQRQQVEGYLAWKWKINSLLPTTHPYYKIRP